MMKQRSKLETKKLVAPKKDCSFKSKAKKVNSADSGNASYGRKKTLIDSLYQDNDAKKSVRDRAEEVLQSIPLEYPRFSKAMLPSNVSYSFWLILPLDFCKFYMPNEDVRVVLVDDRGTERDTTYLTKRHGLSAGWRGFAMEHRLLEGDILVFHMISPYRFKVNIVRVYGLDVADAALILMLIHDSRNKTYDEAKDSSPSRKSEKGVKTLGQVEAQSESQFDDCIAEVPEVKKEMTPKKLKKRVKKLGQVEDQSETRFDDCSTEVSEVKKELSLRKSKKRVKKLRQAEDQSETRFDYCSTEASEAKKQLTPRKSKKRVKKLGLIEGRSERQSDDCNADVPEGSGIAEYELSNELNHWGTHLMQDHYHNSIGCM
ncbi:uncharacterized protein LOC141684573 isoform X2 [Apium graveolens]|uniref:uncharacterized protein LOC141684573 isoform X2 n=1 Tax=Apium graveolens TaxID=4045 RepID=UPI003D7A4F46